MERSQSKIAKQPFQPIMNPYFSKVMYTFPNQFIQTDPGCHFLTSYFSGQKTLLTLDMSLPYL